MTYKTAVLAGARHSSNRSPQEASTRSPRTRHTLRAPGVRRSSSTFQVSDPRARATLMLETRLRRNGEAGDGANALPS